MAEDKKHNRWLPKREERIKAQVKPKGDNVIARRRRGNPAWKKGMAAPAGAGRPRGSRNKVTQQRFEEMCDLVLGAAACYGYDGTGTGGAEGYVTMLAQRFPLQFMTIILARLVPKVVERT